MFTGKSIIVITFSILLSWVMLTACQMQSAQSETSPASESSTEVQARDFVTGLRVPWELAFLPDGRMLITERTGTIRVVQNGELQDEPWITLAVAATGEAGLLGMAVDPDFSANGYVYAAYTYRDASGDLENQLVRLKEDPTTGRGVLDTVLLNNVDGGGNHDGGRVKIGPDGKIYWTMGDAGNGDSAQDLSSLNGKILRLNPDGTVPEDNPYSGSFIFSYGHRNPQGIAWQPGTGRLYATEHGPSGQDEVNYVQPGNNYGWPVIRGTQTREGMVSPIIQSGTSDTWAPSGSDFIEGGPWDGSFVFTGLRGQSLYRLVPDAQDPSEIAIFEEYLSNQCGRLRNVVQGPDGTIYLLTNNTDGRGSPRPGDDRILILTVQ